MVSHSYLKLVLVHNIWKIDEIFSHYSTHKIRSIFYKLTYISCKGPCSKYEHGYHKQPPSLSGL